MARLQPFSRSIELLVSRSVSPQARSQAIARVHRKAVSEAEAQNRAAMGAVLPSETWVDGRKGAALESVDPDRGVILTRFETGGEVVDYVWRLLVERSPVLTGAYRSSHRLFADGVEMVEPDPTLPAKEWVIISTIPYARKIEQGQGEAPDDGVYEGAAALARQRFGNVANIQFMFQSVVSGGVQARGRQRENRFPAIVITMR